MDDVVTGLEHLKNNTQIQGAIARSTSVLVVARLILSPSLAPYLF